jgi:CheY-like chemotaxis protein
VLIVDDDVQARELLLEFCRAQGYEVATANDRRAAIAALTWAPKQFGIVITDLLLRGRRVRGTDGRPSLEPVGLCRHDYRLRQHRFDCKEPCEGAYDYLAERSPAASSK